jgi:ferredoxin
MTVTKINHEFSNEMTQFGGVDFNACFNCGNCTAVCDLSDKNNSFPRALIRYSVLGIEGEIQNSIKPWLCYYCGDCSTSCPRQANPAELMMAIRRWLIAKYDWTGLSRILFKSLTASIIAFILVALLVIGVSIVEKFNPEKIMHIGHSFEMVSILIVFLVILTPNIIRMWWLTIVKNKIKVPISQYFKALPELLTHMFTQKAFLECEEEKFRWFEHMILVYGYLLLLFITVFLDWFSTDNLVIILSGYIISAVVFIITFDFVLARRKKSKEFTKFSHPSDWFFVIWLFLMSITAFAVRIFVDTGLIENNIWIFIVHIIILAQWALIIVPFGKWTHFLYRSFAMYFDKIIIDSKKNK